MRVYADRIEVELDAGRVATALLLGDAGNADVQMSGASEQGSDPDADSGVQVVRLTISAAFKRTGKEMKFIVAGAEATAKPDAGLVRLLMRAHALKQRLASSPGSPLADVGAQERMGAPYAVRLMRLNYLAPDIVIAILSGRQPAELTAAQLMTDTRLPLDWSEQRAALGFG